MDNTEKAQGMPYLCRHTYYSELNEKRAQQRRAAASSAKAASAANEARSADAQDRIETVPARERGETAEQLDVRQRIDAAILHAAEWLEIDDRARRVEHAGRRLPVSVMAAMLAVALSLLMIVAGAVISAKANMELYAVENELSSLEATEQELARKLELKNDLRYIEEEARGRLGMIDREHASVLAIDNDCEDSVELYEQSEGRTFFAALLDALGFFGE